MSDAPAVEGRVTGLHRHETAGLGLRAPRLTGEGREHGRLVRLILLSYTRWPGQPKQDPYPCDATLASRAGLSENEVERAMSRLRAAGIIATRWGKRPGAKPGRLIALDLHGPCKALAPEGFAVRNLWAIARSIRARPAALVTMMVGAYMLASDAAGEEIEDWAELSCSASALRRFVGQADNSSWTKRLRELEALGLIRREGRRVEVSPPRVWFELAVHVAECAAGITHGVVRLGTPHGNAHDHDHRDSRLLAVGNVGGPGQARADARELCVLDPGQHAGPRRVESRPCAISNDQAQRRRGGRDDPHHGRWHLTVLDPALEAEADAYFLVPPQRLGRVGLTRQAAAHLEVEAPERERQKAAGER